MGNRLEPIEYQNYKCIKFSNGKIDLIIPTDIGPRILFAGFKNEKNLFGSAPFKMNTPYGVWKLYGGHRLWTSPEIFPFTQYPDNKKIEIIKKGQTLVLTQKIKQLRIAKEIRLKFASNNRVKIIHRIHNNGKKDLNFAIWALSVMAKGGFAIVPQNLKKEDEKGLLPTQNIVLWRYSAFNDPRWKKTDKYVYIKQGGKVPFKIGQRVSSNWCAYYNEGYLFVKKFSFNPFMPYPDFYSNVEIYSCKEFLELETLSPLVDVKPGQSLSYTEIWEFYKNRKISFGQNNKKII